MAEENDGASKTEEPTGRKLQQARDQGDVVKTPDLPQLASFLAAAGVLMALGEWLSRNLTVSLTPFLAHPDAFSLEGGGGVQVARLAMLASAPILAAVMGAAALAGVAGNLGQTGLLWTPSRLEPKFDKVSPMAGFKRVFGLDALMQFVKSLLKVVLVAVIGWMIIKPHMHEIEQMSGMDPLAMLPYALNLLKKLIFAVGAFMLAVAGLDWFWQRQRFYARHRMTKEEIKEDYKQTEGDPHVKARQRQIRITRARRRMMSQVPKATVVVMNPTHYAVALRYDPEAGEAPQCVAKGLDVLALKIRAVAEEAGVPVIEDPPLARALYASVEIEDFIPVAHYEAVAKIIGFIMGGKRPRAEVG